MNQLSLEKRVQIVNMLLEGNSLRAISRIADVSINTVIKLLIDLGTACQQYHDENVKELNCKRIQCDEIWAFIYGKDKNLPPDLRGQYGFGSIWTWVAIDADSKFVVSYLVGNRDAEFANIFMQDVSTRLNNKVQLTTDGLKAYLDAVENTFGANIDFAQLVKMYGKPINSEHRYSPVECTGIKKTIVRETPREKHISTSFVERQNLNMRMSIRRFTRLTNEFSKKIENHSHAIALHFMYYNFVRIHKSLRVTPAMQVGLTNHLWKIEDLVKLIS